MANHVHQAAVGVWRRRARERVLHEFVGEGRLRRRRLVRSAQFKPTSDYATYLPHASHRFLLPVPAQVRGAPRARADGDGRRPLQVRQAGRLQVLRRQDDDEAQPQPGRPLRPGLVVLLARAVPAHAPPRRRRLSGALGRRGVEGLEGTSRVPGHAYNVRGRCGGLHAERCVTRVQRGDHEQKLVLT